ncbi:transcriptional adapter ADA2-like [Cicer arietinum]|uniref:transcriptional adapter ADA2-like n=1 Tax=Cicer arietinum TaxID=3827 RepID=UPI003CC6ACFB
MMLLSWDMGKDHQLKKYRGTVAQQRAIKEARIAGCVTAVEAYRFIEQKKTKEAEQGACKESGLIGTSVKTLQRPIYPKIELGSSPRGLHKGTTASFAGIKDTHTAIQAITRSLEEWDISDFEGAELLSESL